MSQLADAGGMSSLEHCRRATYAQSSQMAGVAGGLKPPRERHDDVGAVKNLPLFSDGISFIARSSEHQLARW
jgi:hypothetical protein